MTDTTYDDGYGDDYPTDPVQALLLVIEQLKALLELHRRLNERLIRLENLEWIERQLILSEGMQHD